MFPTFNFNKIIKILIITDLFIFSSWGLIMPVLAVFIVNSINGGDAGVAGMAVGIYWVTKSLLQVPIGKYLDRKHGERDDYWLMVGGSFLASLTPLIFLISSEPWHIYGLQIFHAVGMAMVVPTWGGIFIRHIDKGREAETTGFDSSIIGFGIGVVGIAGGLIAKTFGFVPLFIGVSVLGIIGSALLLLIKKEILPKDGRVMHIKRPEHVR